MSSLPPLALVPLSTLWATRLLCTGQTVRRPKISKKLPLKGGKDVVECLL